MLGGGHFGAARILQARHQMGRVAIVTSHTVVGVGGVFKAALLSIALVALDADLSVALWVAIETENQLLGSFRGGIVAPRGRHGVGVSFARAVTHLTTLDRILAHRSERGVLGLFVLQRLRTVATSALFRAYIFTLDRGNGNGGNGTRFRRGGPRLGECPARDYQDQ